METNPPSRRRASAIGLVLVLLLVAGFVFFGIMPRQARGKVLAADVDRKRADAATVAVLQVQAGADTAQLRLPGQMRPLRETPLYARSSGYVRRFTADIGQVVRQGQVLAQIEAPEVYQELREASANLDLTRVNLERLRSVRLPGAVSRQDVDARQTAYDANRANVQRLTELQNLLTVRAPFTGRITARTVQVGNLVTGAAGAEPLFRLEDASILRVFIDVPQAYAADVRPGLPVTLSVPEFPDETFAGRVVRSAGSLDVATRTLRVEVQVPNPNNRLLPGLYVQVAFDLPTPSRAVVIPANTLLVTSQGMQVAVVGADDKLRFQPISIGRDYGSRVEVRQGLRPGERVVLNPNDRLTAGMKVTAVLRK